MTNQSITVSLNSLVRDDEPVFHCFVKQYAMTNYH